MQFLHIKTVLVYGSSWSRRGLTAETGKNSEIRVLTRGCLQCGIRKAMSALLKAPCEASKDSVHSLICLICSPVCVLAVESVTVFIVWLSDAVRD